MNNKIAIGSGVILAITAMSYSLFGFETLFGELFNTALYLLAPVLAVSCGIWAVKKFTLKSVHGVVFFQITIGIALWLIADMAYAVLSYIFGIEPFPSFVDAIYLAGYLPILLGIIKEVNFYSIEWGAKKIIISTIAMLFLAFFGFYAVAFLSMSEDASLMENFVNIAYGLGDAVLGLVSISALLVMVEIGKGRFSKPWFLFFLAILLTFIADCIYGLYSAQYDADVMQVKLIDLIYAASYLLFANFFFEFAKILDDMKAKLNSLA